MMTLRGQRLIGAAVFALVFMASTAVMISAIGDLRQASDRRGKSERAIELAANTERLVIDLETGQRGFIITSEERFLQPWHEAQRKLPRSLRMLAAAAELSPQQARGVHELGRRVRSYLRDYSIPTIRVARRDPSRARKIVRGSEGKRRVDDLRARFDELVEAEQRQVAAKDGEAGDAARMAITLAVVGIGGTLILLVAFELYMRRMLTRPLARTAQAVNRLANGELNATACETGPTELASLARSFNRMARSLQESQQKLEHRNAELGEARLVAERASLAKSEFLSRVSHELRTPLNGVLGFGQLLEMGEPAPPNDRYVEQVLKAGRHLLTLIDELLDISQIEAGQMSLSLEAVDAAGVVSDVLGLIQPMADGRDIAMTAVDPHEPRWVRADQQRLRQVLLNLVSNAIKYNREGGTVQVALEPAEPDRMRLLVSDTGVGIAPEDIERLFVAFDRLGAERTAVDGTGLGLTLSKRLVEVMGGTLGVHSEPGVGTTLAIELARAESPLDQHGVAVEKMSATTPGLSLPEATVLCIEDNLANLELVRQILAGQPGIELMAAETGGIAIQLATGHVPDLVLLDLHLPDMSGEEILVLLRRDERTRDIPVIVVSADATRDQVDRLLAAGAAAYLTKPLDVRRFLDLIGEHLALRSLALS
jgi:signal transduction histidine kinase/ActR/RegA family two-component response regulator